MNKSEIIRVRVTKEDKNEIEAAVVLGPYKNESELVREAATSRAKEIIETYETQKTA